MRTSGFTSKAIVLWSIAAFGLTVLAEPSSRQELVVDYVAALNACDRVQLAALLHDDHEGFAVRGPLGAGMDGETLQKQCEAGYALDLRPTSTTWLTDDSDLTQIAGVELTGTLSHPVRGTNSNNLRITLVARRDPSGELKVLHTHYSALR